MFFVMIRVTSCSSSLILLRLPAGPPSLAEGGGAERESLYCRVVLDMKLSANGRRRGEHG